MLNELDRNFEVKTIFKLCPANADGDNLIIDGITFPLLRQQVKKKENEPFLCLSDFVRPLSSGITDVVGAFASSIDADMEGLYEKDPYKHLLVQTLSDRLAEAATEKMHEYVRKEVWGKSFHTRSSCRKVSRHPSCCGIPFSARPIRELHPGRDSRYETNRYPPDREWCHVSSCFRMRINVCPSRIPIFLRGEDR